MALAFFVSKKNMYKLVVEPTKPSEKNIIIRKNGSSLQVGVNIKNLSNHLSNPVDMIGSIMTIVAGIISARFLGVPDQQKRPSNVLPRLTKVPNSLT